MSFPQSRPRRLRKTPELRRLVRETRLSVDALIYPVFVQAGIENRTPIPSMPGQYRWPVGQLGHVAQDVRSRGIPAIVLFGMPESKDETGSGAYGPDGVAHQARPVS